MLRTQDVERNVVGEGVGRNNLTHIDSRVFATHVLDDEIIERLPSLGPSPAHLLHVHVNVSIRCKRHATQRQRRHVVRTPPYNLPNRNSECVFVYVFIAENE